jgi:Kdo2-lipid IVA lauroyltransferase/acyltransferase
LRSRQGASKEPRMAGETPSFATRLGWRLEALAFDVFSGVLRLFPVDAVSAMGGWLLRTLGPLTGEHWIADLNLRLAFPEMGDAERRRILRGQWDNLGRTAFEFAIMDRIAREPGRVEAAGVEAVLELLRRGRPIVMFSGHFANWEAIPAAAARIGLKLRISYRRANNPLMDRRIVEGRLKSGIHLFAPKGKEGNRELIGALKRGEVLGFLNDQRDSAGVEAPFFGRLVRTAPGPVRLALSNDAVLAPVAVERLKGARFVARVYEPFELERTGDRARDIQAGVARVNAFMEARIREAPEQWLWAHRRWPVEVYAQLKRRPA